MLELPDVRGTLTPQRVLADLTWMRVGGPADVLFQPADLDDLSAFLAALDPAVPVFPMGVGSNLIVRDGGIGGVVIRLGRGKRYRIDYDLCTGCQACVLQCPCNAMEMVPMGVTA